MQHARKTKKDTAHAELEAEAREELSVYPRQKWENRKEEPTQAGASTMWSQRPGERESQQGTWANQR